MADNLILKGSTWHVRLELSEDLRLAFGYRRKLTKSLKNGRSKNESNTEREDIAIRILAEQSRGERRFAYSKIRTSRSFIQDAIRTSRVSREKAARTDVVIRRVRELWRGLKRDSTETDRLYQQSLEKLERYIAKTRKTFIIHLHHKSLNPTVARKPR
ncbi:hypothetical protein [Vreelandella boliviensis]|uniref:hypothetical protein n=1 Tax=Vreelandella boliviensis TaxID=223527 RepID=UPI001140EEF6|nr:hypothetical protein [Halomonas boliviensis]